MIRQLNILIYLCCVEIYAYNGRDYIVAIWKERTMDWNQAEQYCIDTYESHLATMLTQIDYQRAYNYSYFGGFIGLTSKNKDGKYKWIDGSPCESDTETCTEYFNPNEDIPGYCSIIPWGGYKCNEALCSTTHTQFYCNKVRSYNYVKEAKSYKDAETFCQTSFGTHLATITSKLDINNALNKMLKSNKNSWVGLYKSMNNNVWIDGTEYIQGDLNEFVELTDDGSNCRSFNYNESYIRDSDGCEELLPFLCNKQVKPREYILGLEKDKTFDEAEEICKKEYGTGLATVITEREFSDAMELLPYFEAGWVGLKRENDNGYKWIDGTECSVDSDECVPYWNEHDVDEPNYDCVMLWQNGRAKSRQCENIAEYFLCNKPVVVTPISEGQIDVKTEI